MLSSSIRSILKEIITNLLPESTAPPHHPPTDARSLKIIIFHYCGRQVKLMCSISIITWCSNYAWPETMVKLRAIANRSICSDNMKRLVRYYDRLRGAGVVYLQIWNIFFTWIFIQDVAVHSGWFRPIWKFQIKLVEMMRLKYAFNYTSQPCWAWIPFTVFPDRLDHQMTIFPQHFQLFTCSSLNSLVSHWAWAKPKTPDKKPMSCGSEQKVNCSASTNFMVRQMPQL